MVTDSSSRSVIADWQVTVRLQAGDAVPGPRAGPGIMPGPEGGVVPGRRHDAAGGMSRARHLAVTVADPGSQPVL